VAQIRRALSKSSKERRHDGATHCIETSGFQWDQVLKDIVMECPKIYLARHPDENIPAFMVAVTCINTQSFCRESGKSFAQQQYTAYKERNTIQSTYLLLRANPTMIVPTYSALPSEEGDKKRKADNKSPKGVRSNQKKNKS
jgi:hypothetical protein